MQISTPMPQKAAVSVAKDVQVNRNTQGEDSQFSLNGEAEQAVKTGASDSEQSVAAANQAKPDGKTKNEKIKDTDEKSDTEDAAQAVENAFPQLPPQVKEQITQWLGELRDGKISAHDLADKIAKQLQSAGVTLPAPALAAMENLFKQVATGDMPVSASRTHSMTWVSHCASMFWRVLPASTQTLKLRRKKIVRIWLGGIPHRVQKTVFSSSW